MPRDDAASQDQSRAGSRARLYVLEVDQDHFGAVTMIYLEQGQEIFALRSMIGKFDVPGAAQTTLMAANKGSCVISDESSR